MEDSSDNEVEAFPSHRSYSSLPQSVLEALESVRAECESGVSRGFGSSIIETPLSPINDALADPKTAVNWIPKTGIMKMASRKRADFGVHEDVSQTRPHPVSSESREEKLNINRILSNSQKANSSHWIKIDLPIKRQRLLGGAPTTSNTPCKSHLTLKHDSKTIPKQHDTGRGSVEIPELRTPSGHSRRMEKDDVENKATLENDATKMMGVLGAESLRPEPNSVISSHEASTLTIHDSLAETMQVIHNRLLPHFKSPERKEKSNKLEIAVKKRTSGVGMPTKKDIGYQVCHFSEDDVSAKKIYHELNTEYEDMEEFARVCDDEQIRVVGNIKVDNFGEDEYQEIPGNGIHRNSDGGGTAGFPLETSSLTMWRQELLSSDFNLIYGSLRAVLMRNISKDELHRLIQTMIATMGEIEEITMGEGNPVHQSVRCGTPDLGEKDEKVDGNRQSENEADEPVKIKKEFSPPLVPSLLIRPGDAPTDNVQLRERELIMNRERIRRLMKVGPDGMAHCLVCLKQQLPPNRVCRACATFACRIERNYTLGFAIPTCRHEDYRCSPRCKSCRFRKFCFMSMTETTTRLRGVRERTCPVCKTVSYQFRGWKCMDCHNFFARRLRKKEPITCEHFGEYPNKCDGCRNYCFQIEWANHEPPYHPYPLPLVTEKELLS